MRRRAPRLIIHTQAHTHTHCERDDDAETQRNKNNFEKRKIIMENEIQYYCFYHYYYYLCCIFAHRFHRERATSTEYALEFCSVVFSHLPPDWTFSAVPHSYPFRNHFFCRNVPRSVSLTYSNGTGTSLAIEFSYYFVFAGCWFRLATLFFPSTFLCKRQDGGSLKSELCFSIIMLIVLSLSFLFCDVICDTDVNGIRRARTPSVWNEGECLLFARDTNATNSE